MTRRRPRRAREVQAASFTLNILIASTILEASAIAATFPALSYIVSGTGAPIGPHHHYLALTLLLGSLLSYAGILLSIAFLSSAPARERARIVGQVVSYFVVQGVGLVLGVTVLVLLALFEVQISVPR